MQSWMSREVGVDLGGAEGGRVNVIKLRMHCMRFLKTLNKEFSLSGIKIMIELYPVLRYSFLSPQSQSWSRFTVIGNFAAIAAFLPLMVVIALNTIQTQATNIGILE